MSAETTRDSAGRPTDRSLGAIHDRYKAASAHVDALCRGAKWTMSVPVRVDRDSDTLISDALEDIPRLVNRIVDAWVLCGAAIDQGNGMVAAEHILALLDGKELPQPGGGEQ